MLTYAIEKMSDILAEIDSLLLLHYEELTLDKDKVKLAPRWDRYVALENAGMLAIFTVRSAGALVGYAVFFINKHMHYGDLTLAVNDVVFLHPHHRTGSVGLRLLRMCEKYFSDNKKDDETVKIAWHAKLDTNLQRLLERMDYSIEDVIFGKIL